MAQLVLITALQQKPGSIEIDDIAGFFPDDNQFTQREWDAYNIIQFAITPPEVNALKPQVRKIFRLPVIGWTTTLPERKRIWRDTDNQWKELVKRPGLLFRFEAGEVKHNIDRYPENFLNIITPSG